ncbi:helix-turn-helix domain-containing protein [Caproiciproducens galactitolivorans]|uniref:helix-turn-helix domain-containing protein n=1 Tax=Caproiciproducens galactitolivorans TaxID=642589 RepID=UPI0010829306|nr:helix-turn-helix domain-containing protein [Caproiciproducens galactitolivorans]QEY33843.1 helix-turn-helix domain-containing protein [Caproiciproducens galactitolivorans]QEY34652.1 helix-turn-helix domain-containing protein [Caproiciproducens galactitolivorans]
MQRYTNWNALPLVLDIDVAAMIAGYHPAYLRKLARQGEFPAKQNKPRGKWRISKDELRGWITNQADNISA